MNYLGMISNQASVAGVGLDTEKHEPQGKDPLSRGPERARSATPARKKGLGQRRPRGAPQETRTL